MDRHGSSFGARGRYQAECHFPACRKRAARGRVRRSGCACWSERRSGCAACCPSGGGAQGGTLLPFASAMLPSPELLRRLDVPGPRYTSYPTVPVWSERFGPEEHGRALAKAGSSAPDAPLSIYVHIPFCRELCTYCGCNVVITRDAREGGALSGGDRRRGGAGGRAARRAPLGLAGTPRRRHAHVSRREAALCVVDGAHRPVSASRRRRVRGRDQPGGDPAGAARAARRARLSAAVDGRAGLRAFGAGGDRAGADGRADARDDGGGARARLPRHQPRSNLWAPGRRKSGAAQRAGGDRARPRSGRRLLVRVRARRCGRTSGGCRWPTCRRGRTSWRCSASSATS